MMGAKGLVEQKPRLFNYHDYRGFVRDWMAYSKLNYGLSLRQIAVDTGLSVSFLSMMLAGRRKLSPKAIQKLLPIFEFTASEEEYFLLLQTIGDSESHQERVSALNKIHKLASYKKLNTKELEVYKYLSHWYYVAIREMVMLREFKLDAAWIQSQLNYFVPVPEINNAIAFLIDYGFIETLPNGGARLPEKRIECFEGIYKIALSSYYKEMFQLASDSIEKIPRVSRSLGFETMAISSENFEDVRKILEEARKKIEELGRQQKDPDAVYHVSFAAFPLVGAAQSSEEGV